MAAPTYDRLEFQLAGDAISAALALAASFQGIEVRPGTWDLPRLPRIKLASGVLAGQFNAISGFYAGSATGPTDYDLTSLMDGLGNPLDFELVKFAIVFNFATTAGHVLTIDPSVTNGWTAPFGGVSASRLDVQPGYLTTGGDVMPGIAIFGTGGLAGMAVSPTSKVVRLDAGANTVPYAFVVVGVDS